jgi:hypothetical protein
MVGRSVVRFLGLIGGHDHQMGCRTAIGFGLISDVLARWMCAFDLYVIHGDFVLCGSDSGRGRFLFNIEFNVEMPRFRSATSCLHPLGRLGRRAPSAPTCRSKKLTNRDSTAHSPISILNDDVLLNIFYLYRLGLHNMDKDEDMELGEFVWIWKRQRWWYSTSWLTFPNPGDVSFLHHHPNWISILSVLMEYL